MGLFEKVAVIDLKLRLSLAAGVFVFAAAVLAGTTVGGGERSFWSSVAIGLVCWVAIATLVYQRLPS